MEKYLRLYAEPETAALEPLLTERESTSVWEHVLVIPACDETAELLRPPPPCAGRSLLILVINETENASDAVSKVNHKLAEAVSRAFGKQWQSADEFKQFHISLFSDPDNPRDILMVDRFSQGRKLPQKGGVGHARKIGADLVAFLFHHGRIRSNWIHCSDGDTRLPDTYFSSSVEPDPNYSALVYPYRHVEDLESDDRIEINHSTQRYELSLRYYVAGLRLAGSPYAFHTIGSTMAISANHYAKVRGFPRREAGEDFYLLNKLAKVGKVHELKQSSLCGPIEIMSRRSQRVPFGTGAAVNKITVLDDPANNYLYYHPRVFILLQSWLSSLPGLWARRSTLLDEGLFSSDDIDKNDVLALIVALEQIGIGKALDHAFRQSRDFDQFQRQLHTWFDAFRTLKLIHALRDSHLPSINLEELGSKPEFRRLLNVDESLRALHQQVGHL
jgi:hypothetical protein